MYSKVPHTHVRAPRRTGEPPEMETVLNCHLKLQTEELLWGMGSGRGSREARPTRASSTCRLRSGLLGGEPPAVLSHRPRPSAVRGGGEWRLLREVLLPLDISDLLLPTSAAAQNQHSHYGEQCGDSLKNWK